MKTSIKKLKVYKKKQDDFVEALKNRFVENFRKRKNKKKNHVK